MKNIHYLSFYLFLFCFYSHLNYNYSYSLDNKPINDTRITINDSGEVFICGIKQIYTSKYLLDCGMIETRAGFFEKYSITKKESMLIMNIDDDYLLRQRATTMPPIQYVVMLNDGSYAVMKLCDENYKPKNIRSLIPDDDALVDLTIVNNLKMNQKIQK